VSDKDASQENGGIRVRGRQRQAVTDNVQATWSDFIPSHPGVAPRVQRSRDAMWTVMPYNERASFVFVDVLRSARLCALANRNVNVAQNSLCRVAGMVFGC
jgi:hypothetical protein